MKRIYFDYSATTPLDPDVFEAMRPYFLQEFGNASSVHEFGRKARAAVDKSRAEIAAFIGAAYDELTFTSGGTESDNYAIKGVAVAARESGRDHLIVSAIEHQAVLQPALSLQKQGFQLDFLPVDRNGIVNLDELRRLVTSRTALISVMHANNEIGSIQPISEVAAVGHAAGTLVHTDAVQSLGKIPVDVRSLGVDLLSISAHKIYGPKGIGALFIRKGTKVTPLLEGGGQEQNRRAGTENVPLIVGFSKAIDLARRSMESGEPARWAGLKEILRKRLVADVPGLMVNGNPDQTLPTILNVSFDSSSGVDGEALIIGMDLEGVAVTSGSACAAGTLEPSHVLIAMGRDEKTARATIRFSLGRQTTEEDVHEAVTALQRVLKKMRNRQDRPAAASIANP